MQTRGPFEIKARIAAFFDLDGTLLAPPSLERRFFRLLRRRRLFGARQYFAWLCEAARMLPLGVQQIAHANKMFLRGVPAHTACLEPPVLPFYREAIERVNWHAERGHLLVIVSGTLDPLARLASAELMERLSITRVDKDIRVCATRVEGENARWTGRILGEAMFGEAKARAIRQIGGEAGLNLERSFAYGDSVHDCLMLEAVGRPVTVNPSSDLARIARRNHWPILQWSELGYSTRPASVSPRTKDENAEMSMHPQPAASEQTEATATQIGPIV